ncbi:MAG TPA: hypothetical protein VI341_10465 [Actinomycetota bacterium]
MKPIVLVPTHDLVPIVTAGATRAGRGPTISVSSERGSGAVAMMEGATGNEMAVVSFQDRAAVNELAFLLVDQGARLIPALVARLGVGVEPTCLDWLGELPVGSNVAVPSLDEDVERRRLWASLHDAGASERHHVLDVDGRPALDELLSQGRPVEGDQLELLAVGAAGVLAGRMVVAGRRWQRSIED